MLEDVYDPNDIEDNHSYNMRARITLASMPASTLSEFNRLAKPPALGLQITVRAGRQAP